MSQEPKAEAPKKKGKLPIIIALLAVLGGGGFFMMKKGGGAKEAPALKLGKAEKLDEFLVNLRDRGVYLRCDLELQFAEKDASGATIDAKHFMEDSLGEVRSAIIFRLRSKSERDLQSNEGLVRLKKEIAADVNKILHAAHAADEPKQDKKGEKKDEKKKEDHGESKGHEEAHNDWDSQEGPVLKVNFHSFATQ